MYPSYFILQHLNTFIKCYTSFCVNLFVLQKIVKQVSDLILGSFIVNIVYISMLGCYCLNYSFL